jgi:phage antirepressor YoqD-like protein
VVFKLQDDDEALDDNPQEEEENAGHEQYLATIRSKLQFYSCIKMVSSGLSFRQVSKEMQDMKETLQLATLGLMSRKKGAAMFKLPVI